jgi:hypothetical protein
MQTTTPVPVEGGVAGGALPMSAGTSFQGRRKPNGSACHRRSMAGVPGPQRLDLGDPALVLGDDPRAALVRDAEQRALELAGDPLQVLGPLLHA